MDELTRYENADIQFNLKLKVVKTKTLPPTKNLKNRDDDKTKLLRLKIIQSMGRLDINEHIELEGASATRELANSYVASYYNKHDSTKQFKVCLLDNSRIGIWRTK